MIKMSFAVEFSFISGMVGMLLDIFGNFRASGIILIILITIDTLLGMKIAIKYKRFTSRGLLKFLKKVILYSTAIITVRLLEIGIVAFINTNLLSQIMAAFLIISEAISILENLTILGVPIPSNFVSIMLNNLKIAGLDKVIEMTKNNEKDILEIEEMIKYQLPYFKDENIRKLLDIKFRIWKSIAYQINDAIYEDNLKSELLYYKVMSLIELSLDEMDYQLKQESVCKECIDKFMKNHDPKIQKWISKVEEICYLDKSVQRKKEELIESIVVLLYQTILDAHKIEN